MEEWNKISSYFPHDSNARNSDKLIRLRMKHKASGYGVYFMILERLRDELNYMSVKDYNMIAFDLREDTSIIKSVIEDFGLFVFTEDGKYFYSESFKRRMEFKDDKKKKRSEAGKKGMESRWGDITKPPDSDNNVITKPPDSDNKESKEKESKEKESKEKKENTLSPPVGEDVEGEKNPPSVPDEKIPSLHSKARAVFESHYKTALSTDYYWTGVDAGSMKNLLNALKFQRKQKGLENSDDEVISALKVFLGSITDKWILEHYSLANINSKFNELIAQARESNVKVDTSKEYSWIITLTNTPRKASYEQYKADINRFGEEHVKLLSDADK